jgi:hypothetical protein
LRTTRFLAGELPGVVGHDTPAFALRFLCDDVKALYGEAAQAEGAVPSSLQVDTWFWQQTVAGALLIALRDVALSSENNAVKTVGGRFLVPAPGCREVTAGGATGPLVDAAAPTVLLMVNAGAPQGTNSVATEHGMATASTLIFPTTLPGHYHDFE